MGLRASIFFVLVLAPLLAAAPRAACAVELSSIDTVAADKKIQLTVKFSAPAKSDVIYHYASNFVALRIEGMKFSAERLKKDMAPPSPEAALSIKSLRFTQDAEGGEIRIYLVKPVTPADVLVVPYEDHLDIEILRPQETGAARSDGIQGQEGSAPDIEPAAGEPLPAAGGDPLPASGTTEPADQLQPDEGTGAPSATSGTELAAAGDPPALPAAEPGDESGMDSAAANGSLDAASVEVSGVEPAAGGKSYKRFDLSKVQVAPVEIRGMPFREALMEMVSKTKFNVVVGEVADNSGVVLNFAQKPMSLKAALDLFCMAYDLNYSVEDDAIVIKSN